jgi:hypothetical protein
MHTCKQTLTHVASLLSQLSQSPLGHQIRLVVWAVAPPVDLGDGVDALLKERQVVADGYRMGAADDVAAVDPCESTDSHAVDVDGHAAASDGAVHDLLVAKHAIACLARQEALRVGID